MKTFKTYFRPILCGILMLTSLFHYEKITTFQNGAKTSFSIGGVEQVTGVTVILILIFMFYITALLKKIVKFKTNQQVKFYFDILFLFAIGISILPHYVIFDTCSDSSKSILVKYTLGITSSQNTKGFFIVAIAILVIVARLYTITKSYWKHSQLSQNKGGKINNEL